MRPQKIIIAYLGGIYFCSLILFFEFVKKKFAYNKARPQLEKAHTLKEKRKIPACSWSFQFLSAQGRWDQKRGQFSTVLWSKVPLRRLMGRF
jgi:hypothetical protein